MELFPGRPAVLRYISDRRCDGGGYCFYRLPEPNAGDTRHALTVHALLGTAPVDPETVSFLQSLQRPDGGFSSVFVANHVLAGLALLGKEPVHDPGPFLLSHLAALGDRELPPEQLSALEGVRAAVDACQHAGTVIDDDTRDGILRHLLSFRHPVGGFGAGLPTLVETADAVRVLVLLGQRNLAEKASSFVMMHENSRDGFIFLEPVAALVRASRLLRQPLRHPDSLRSFVLGLHHCSGGFVRSRYGGSPTLEYTHLAIETLALLNGCRASGGPCRWGGAVHQHDMADGRAPHSAHGSLPSPAPASRSCHAP